MRKLQRTVGRCSSTHMAVLMPIELITVTHLHHECEVPAEHRNQPSKKRKMGCFRHHEKLSDKAVIFSCDLYGQTLDKQSQLRHGCSHLAQPESWNPFSLQEFFSVSTQPNFNPKSEFYMNTEQVLESLDIGT